MEPRPLILPRPPEAQPRHPFPLLASIAPVVGSAVIWLITSSAFALVFAALGPIIAVSTMLDSRIHARRALRRDRSRFATELVAARTAISAAHERERALLVAASPGVIAMIDSVPRDPERWRSGLDAELGIALGIGPVASRLRVQGDHDEVAELAEAAAGLMAPVVVDARLGIGIVGPVVATRAILRGFALQVAARLPPECGSWTAGPTEAEWLRLLPHRGAVVAEADRMTWADEHGSIVLAGAPTVAGLPHECRIVLSAGTECAVMSHPDQRLCVRLEPERVSLAQAAVIAAGLAESAIGRAGSGSNLPDSIALEGLLPHGPLPHGPSPDDPLSHETWPGDTPPKPGGLAATFLVDGHGAFPLDLVAQGPHAVIAGMTGSGKSELLVSWLLAMAARYGPDEVTFLLVDFKGGASFGPVVALAHVVGLVTDLDQRTAYRALVSLMAEVRFRERVLAMEGARSIDELRGPNRMPRLVIVVDEFAALVSGFDELHGLFADLAARGRSLGVHLVLCTQRPAGVVRDSVLANVPLRLSLRVNNRADSVAVVGTDAAATLPANPIGRAVVALAGADPFVAQIALATPADADRIARLWHTASAPRRPWCDDLPASISLEEVLMSNDEAGRRFGLLDLPSEQRQSAALWSPETDGNLLVLGVAGSGKSVALAALAARADAAVSDAAADFADQVVLVPAGPEGAWDTIVGAAAALRSGRARPTLYLIDDLDALLPRFGDDHEPAFVDLLVDLLRTGASVGVHLAITARRLTSRLQAVAAVCDSTLVLRQQNRQEHLLVGGDPDLYDAAAPPGRGEWRGAAVQVALAQAPAPRPDGMADPGFEPAEWDSVLVVSGRPDEFVRRWGAVQLGGEEFAPGQLTVRAASTPRVIVGGADAWHADWTRLTALRATSAMLFDGCSLADVRALAGTRRLPPPIERPGLSAWLLEPGGDFRRVRL